MFRKSFAEIETRAHEKLQDFMGEVFTFVPMVRPVNGRAQSDPSRQEKVVRVIFEWCFTNSELGLKRVDVTSREPRITAQRCDFDSDPRVADRFVRCSTGEVYEVTKVERDGFSGITIHLVQFGREA